MFDRAKAFDQPQDVSSTIQKDMAELNSLFEKAVYSAGDKLRMIALLSSLGLSKKDDSTFVLLRVLRGKLLKRPRQGPVEVVADGRDDWVGWAELKTAPVNAVAMMNTGRVIRDVDADILAVVEAESRPVLKLFSEIVLGEVGGREYQLFARVQGAGLFRKGAWPGKNPKRWTVYPELEREVHVASDHPVIWADIGP